MDFFHNEMQRASLNHITRGRHAPQTAVDEPAQRLAGVLGEARLGDLIHIIQIDPSVEHEFTPLELPIGEFLGNVILIPDFPDDLFDDVFDRHQSGRAAVFIDDDRHLHPPGLHLSQQIVHPFGLRDKVGRPHNLAYRSRVLALTPGGEQIFNIHKSDDVVDRPGVDRRTRITGLQQAVCRFDETGRLFEGEHVNAGDHDLSRQRVTKLEDRVDHVFLVLLDGTADLPRIDEGLDFLFGDPGIPEPFGVGCKLRSEPGNRTDDRRTDKHA